MCQVQCFNKEIELINQYLTLPMLRLRIDNYINFSLRTVLYNLPKTIQLTVFNSNKVSYEVNIIDFLFDPNYFSCNGRN